jgi:hypothetical protein
MVPDNVKMMLSELVEQEGLYGAVVALQQAIDAYADEMSDLGIKERAVSAGNVSEMLRDVLTSLEE